MGEFSGPCNAPAVAEGVLVVLELWLVPNVADAKVLHSIISKAAARHDSPPTHPHVTLFSLDEKDETKLKEITQTVVAGVKKPISLDVGGVLVGETLHQSVYLELKSTNELGTLRTSLLGALGNPTNTDYPAFPHIPLYYGKGATFENQSVVTNLLAARFLDTRNDGMVEVMGLKSPLDLTEVWIVNIAPENPAGWTPRHRLSIAGAELAPYPLPPASPTTSRRETGESATSPGNSPTSPGPPSPMTPRVRHSAGSPVRVADGNDVSTIITKEPGPTPGK